MLIHYLRAYPWDGSIWLIAGLLQWAVVFSAHHGGTIKSHRAFAAYIWFAAITTTALMLIPPGDGFKVYMWLSFPFALVQTALGSFCIAELYSQTLAPRISLPKFTPRNLAVLLGLEIATSLIVADIFAPHYGPDAIRVIWFCWEGFLAANALALWVLVFYSHRLGRCWLRRAAQLRNGYLLTLTANAVMLIIIGSGAKNTAWAAQRIGQLADILALGWWSWTLWRREPITAEATEAMIAQAVANHRETMRALSAYRKPVKQESLVTPGHRDQREKKIS